MRLERLGPSVLVGTSWSGRFTDGRDSRGKIKVVTLVTDTWEEDNLTKCLTARRAVLIGALTHT
ncbi:hypothetical protein K1718_12595 [Roseibium porphyridii]|uniref:Uncharacterized protein n=1 Tax=Roseibium porphyridii TaxID=2866279 RepID=A0ABY8F9Z9_9HYPH|nr:hypothetical protein [Roseibium sp. KMA01]WFE92161.1 hypothetical protein K1718_12595 [Roseibium sp. KMA01]